MAKNSIRDYSATNSSNTDIQSIDISEGCSPAGINNAIREVMADLKDVSTGAVALESPAMDSLTVDTTGIVYSSGNVGIGTSSPNSVLHLSTSNDPQITLTDTGFGASADITGSNGNLRLNSQTATIFDMADSEVVRIDSSGNLGIGTTSPASDVGLGKIVEIEAATAGFKATATGGSSMEVYSASTASYVDTTTNHPIIFRPNKSEAMRISGGDVLVGKTSSSLSTAGHEFLSSNQAFHTRDSGNVLYVNRLTNDGSLVVFYQDTSSEGIISVSGTTVSYNGGHLARWSQLTDGTKDETIVKGTVLTNLDQMAVWHHEAVAATYYVEGDELPEITPATYYTEDDILPEGVSVGDEKTAAVYAQIGDEKTPAADAYTEDNEQLNCMAVSSVEGDPNVAGVFVNWDNDDDEFNDMNIAMTGDMVIRIAQGTTVARGDLLMSAGDGTAKPQGDDIIRSKTIAKVTSTHVSHTYDDGSYLVPCVLMAC